MPTQQPAGWGKRATIVDPSLPHQMQLIGKGGNVTSVSCNCVGGKSLGIAMCGNGQLATLFGIYQRHLREST